DEEASYRAYERAYERVLESLKKARHPPGGALQQTRVLLSSVSRSLFDHLISAGEQRLPHGKADRLRGLEIDPKSLRALTLFSSSIKPVAWRQGPQGSKQHLGSCSSRDAHPN